MWTNDYANFITIGISYFFCNELELDLQLVIVRS